MLTDAVIKLQTRYGFTDTYMAEQLGLTRSQYMTTMGNKRFQSDEERAKLPAIFKCDTIEALFKKARIRKPGHWESLINSQQLSAKFGNPTNGWEHD
jgi:hypothetical protein